MMDIAGFLFAITIIWTLGNIHQDLKRLSEKVDRLIETTTAGMGPR